MFAFHVQVFASIELILEEKGENDSRELEAKKILLELKSFCFDTTDQVPELHLQQSEC
jgi:hypothetical protein